jgi:hypothetical protein
LLCAISTASRIARTRSADCLESQATAPAIFQACRACFPTSGSRRPQRRRRTRNGDDALGHAATPAHGRAARHQYPQYHVATLERLAEAGKPLPSPANSFAEYAPEPNPATGKKDVVWFALNDDRPLFAFAGIWAEFKGDRGTKSKPVSGPHHVYGFLTTAPNTVVKPIHSRAMPVILTTGEERDVWMRTMG